MTYNGVGLTTPRGTGTSGFIQRNAGQLAAGGGKTALMWNTRSHYKTTTLRREKGQDIIEHEQKREIELKLLVEREKMEDEGKLTEEEIEDELTRMRGRFTREQDREVQRQAELPSKSVEDFKKAFKIDKDYSEGQAFDRELQDAKKAEKMASQLEENEERLCKELEKEIRIEEDKLALSKQDRKDRKRKRKEDKKRKKEEKVARKKEEKLEAKRRKKELVESLKREKAAAKNIKVEADHIVDGEILKEILKEEKDVMVSTTTAPPARHDSDSDEPQAKPADSKTKQKKRRASSSSSSSGSDSDNDSSSDSSSDSRPRKKARR